MYSTKTEPNYRTTVQVHGPSNSVNGFLGARSVAYLGATTNRFVSSENTYDAIYSELYGRLESELTNYLAVADVDAFCMFPAGSVFLAEPYDSASVILTLPEAQPLEVTGSTGAGNFLRVAVSGVVGTSGSQTQTSVGYVPGRLPDLFCLTAALVKPELEKAVTDSIEAWYSATNPTSAQIAEWVASANADPTDQDFAQIWPTLVFSIVIDYLVPLINRTRQSVTSGGEEARSFFAKWNFYIK